MGKGVPGWSVQRERDHLWSVHTGNLEYAHQSVAGTVPGLRKVPVQYGPSRGVDTVRIDGYLALVLLTHGELVSFHRLMKYGEPLSMGRTHSSIDIYSYKCAAGLKTLLVQYLLMQNRHLAGEEKSPKTRDEWRKVNGGMPLLTDLCLAMRSDPMGMIRGLEEIVTYIYGPAVTFAFPDPLVTAYRYSVTHVRWDDTQLVSAGGAKGTDEQHGALRKGEGSGVGDIQFPRTTAVQDGRQARRPHRNLSQVLEPKSPDSKWTRVLENSRMEEKLRAGERELEAILEKEVLPASIPEFPTVRRMTLGMNSSLVVPSLIARAATEEQQKEFIDGWDPLFIGYSAAIYFHTSDAKINSWTTQARK